MNVNQTFEVEHKTCHLTMFGKTSNDHVFCSVRLRVSRVSLQFAHIYEQLFKAKFQAIFACSAGVINYCEERKIKLLINV